MKRFWQDTALERADGEGGAGWQVRLDARPVRTRGGAAQIVPTQPLGELLRAEWDRQPEEFDAAALPMRDLADRAIDTIVSDREGVIARLAGFAETDTLCYRAEPDEAVHRRQTAMWEPIVAGVEHEYGIALVRTHGILHRSQSSEALARLHERLARENAFTLAGLDAAASLAASLCVALVGLREDADPVALFATANLEEDFQAEQWGRDAEAGARRDRHEAEFLRALEFARAAR